MLALILATLLAQAPTLDDLDFTRAVEESVMATPPEPYRGLIERLGSDCYRCREIASKKLQRASEADQRWLFRGRTHRDPEVRLRCNAIIRRLNPCPSCDGSGVSKHYEGSPCWDCRGLKTIWRYTPWD